MSTVHDLAGAPTAPQPDQTADLDHYDAWADTSDGYRVTKAPGGWLLMCLWCDYETTGRVRRDAVSAYRVEHEALIIDRVERRASRNLPTGTDAG